MLSSLCRDDSDAARKLQSLGCEELDRRGGGSHRKWLNPVAGRTSTLPDWRAKDLQHGTLRAAVIRLGILWDDFNRA